MGVGGDGGSRGVVGGVDADSPHLALWFRITQVEAELGVRGEERRTEKYAPTTHFACSLARVLERVREMLGRRGLKLKVQQQQRQEELNGGQ